LTASVAKLWACYSGRGNIHIIYSTGIYSAGI